jgi:hypothetical protein
MSAELLASQRPSAEILTEETARLCAESVCVQTYRGALAGGVTATAVVADMGRPARYAQVKSGHGDFVGRVPA